MKVTGADRLRAWFATHQRQVLIGSGTLVGGYALYRAHQAGGLGASNGSASVNPNVAGLTAPPADSVSAAAGSNSQLAAIERLLSTRLPAPGSTKPRTPKPPPPLPKPGHGRYVIRRGDTLAKISQMIYGKVTGGTLARLRNANPLLGSFGRNDRLSYYAGDQINLPALAHATPAPKPKPKPHEPPPRGGWRPAPPPKRKN